jgi:beta-exotoxin I transport system permease protein
VLYASSSFTKEAPNLPFFQSPPKALTAFLGGTADFFHAAGWLSAGMSHPVILSLLTSSALLVAAGSVATEVERAPSTWCSSGPLAACRSCSRRRSPRLWP